MQKTSCPDIKQINQKGMIIMRKRHVLGKAVALGMVLAVTMTGCGAASDVASGWYKEGCFQTERTAEPTTGNASAQQGGVSGGNTSSAQGGVSGEAALLSDTEAQKLYVEYCRKSLRQFLKQSWGDNPQQAAVLYSPANLYLVLGMLTEMSDGRTREQIRNAIGGIAVNGDFSSDMSKEEVDAALRKQEQAVIRKAAQMLYTSVSSKKCRLADSVWLSDQYDFRTPVLKALEKNYRAACNTGTMGESSFDRQIKGWVDEQTGGKLNEQTAKSIQTEQNMVLMLLSTLNFKDQWDEPIFNKKYTHTGTFYGQSTYTCGNTTEEEKIDPEKCEFMNTNFTGMFMETEKFQAVSLPLRSARMNVILPKKGISAEEFYKEGTISRIISLCDPQSSGWTQAMIDLTMPKLDFKSELNLIPMLEEMGVHNVFSEEKADFSPLFQDGGKKDVFVSDAQQFGAMRVDEKGCSVASYTQVVMNKSLALADIKRVMKCNRPFLVVVSNEKGLPLFVGAVNRIE